MPTHSPTHPAAVRSLTVAMDGSLVVAANNSGTCYVWRAMRGSYLTTHFEPLHKLRAHQGGARLRGLAAGPEGREGRLLWPRMARAGCCWAALAAGAPRRVGYPWSAAAAGSRTTPPGGFNQLPNSGAALGPLSSCAGYVLKCMLSPDVRQLATTSSDKTVKLWNLDGFTLDRTLAGERPRPPRQPPLPQPRAARGCCARPGRTLPRWARLQGPQRGVRARPACLPTCAHRPPPPPPPRPAACRPPALGVGLRVLRGCGLSGDSLLRLHCPVVVRPGASAFVQQQHPPLSNNDG